MKTELLWEDDSEATDPEMLAALEDDILLGKALLSRLSADEDVIF